MKCWCVCDVSLSLDIWSRPRTGIYTHDGDPIISPNSEVHFVITVGEKQKRIFNISLLARRFLFVPPITWKAAPSVAKGEHFNNLALTTQYFYNPHNKAFIHFDNVISQPLGS